MRNRKPADGMERAKLCGLPVLNFRFSVSCSSFSRHAARRGTVGDHGCPRMTYVR